MPTRVTSEPSSTEAFLRLGFDRFELDEADARLTRAGQPVPLAPKPFAVLCALARTPRTLVTKNALLDSVWGHRFVSESVLKSTISELRAALDDDPKQPRYIETVSRRGYRFIASVSAPARLGRTEAVATTSSSMIGRRMRSSGFARHGSSPRKAGARSCGSPVRPARHASSASWPKPARFIALTGSASSSTARASPISPFSRR